ncbi:MAG: GNAT family N-acetyltransferase [Caldilineaceae bacterium]
MRNSHIQLRPAHFADLPWITALDNDVFGEYGAAEAPTIIAARLLTFPAGCVVLEEESASGQPRQGLGYLTTEKWDAVREPVLDEDPRLTHRPCGHILNITTLVVGRAYQKRGLGERLLHYAIDLARREQCTAIILETARAEAFYRRHGFERVSERQQRGIRLQIMRLLLA